MTIIERLEEKSQWMLFYEYKINGGHLSKVEQEDLYSFIGQEEYLPIVEKIKREEEFSIPKITVLNKKNSNKKRTVFTFPREENYVLKLIAYLLLEYDGVMMPNLYSFRKNKGAKKAIADLVSYEGIGEMCSYKVDIQDYFNSVDVELLLPKLQDVLKAEGQLYQFIERILKNPYAIKEDKIVSCKKGIMAGIPISAFLANLYLTELDRKFYESEILYARYSDDIIVFAKSEDELELYSCEIETELEKMGLSVNPAKRCVTRPGEAWEYLGFSYDKGVIDISEIALQKIKGKLKRKARAIYRWKTKNNKLDEYAIKAYIKHFNKKFFDNPVQNEITWCRWYFPVINTDKSLHIIDKYMQDCVRYLVTGRYTKANYNLRYGTMKELGYRSLVNEYYRVNQE